MMRFLSLLLLGLCGVCCNVVVLGLSVRMSWMDGWMDELTPICQMKDLRLGGSTTCRRESLEPCEDVVVPLCGW